MSVPACPRCGYDLTGAVGSWTLTCPLGIRCSECGLDIELRMVLNETVRGEGVFFESTPVPGRRALLTTALRAMRPWRFWGWVAMAHKFSSARMVAGVLVSAFLYELCIVIAAGSVIVAAWVVDMLTPPKGAMSAYFADEW